MHKSTISSFRIIATLLCGLQFAFALLVVQPPAIALADSTINGTVFQDYNANGIQDTNTQVNNDGQGTVALAVDHGVAGISVTAYDSNGADVGNATTDANGDYQLNASGTGPYRLEFSNLPVGFQPGPVGINNATTVRFINGGAANVDLGILIPDEYCQNNPQLVTNCYRFGDGSTSPVGDIASIIDFPYSAGSSTFSAATGATEPTNHTLEIKVSDVGTTWGLAYARSSKRLFASAFYKKHSSFGPGGPGAIYVIDPATNSVVDTFSVPGATTNAHDTTNYETDNGAVGFAGTGKTSLGGMVISPDEKTLYVMNLENRTLYALDATTGAVLGSQPVPAQPPLTAPATVNACRTGDVRPFAVTYYQGKLYIGMVCSAESAPDTDTETTDGDGNLWINWGDMRELRLYVYSADPATLAFSAQPVFDAPLNNPRAGAYGGGNMLWNGWTDDWDRAWTPVNNSRMYAQPILSDIAFENGNLILGVRDRFGDQGGLNLPFGTSGTIQESISMGATLRACGDLQNGWTLEDNARCNGQGVRPQNTGHGPGSLSLTPPYTSSVGYSSYYNIHAFETHSGDSFGGLAWIPGHEDFVSTGMRPGQIGNSGGIYWVNAVDGTKTKGYQIYAGDAPQLPPYTYGKANGMGDVLVLCDAAPIEIGNRVWNDSNGNGIQDADEQGINGVTVELYRDGTKVGETTTANDGEYYFNNSNVTLNGAAGIVHGTGTIGSNSAYEIRIPSNQVALAGLTATLANASADQRDSDGTLASGNVIYTIPFAALAEAGFNNHTFDFGFAEAGQVQTMSLGNRVWFDANNDGIDNDGAGGLAGSGTGINNVLVQLFQDSNGNGLKDAADSFISQVNTQSNGCYAFSGLTPTTDVTSAYLVVIPNSNFATGATLNLYRNSTGEPLTDSNLDRNDDGRAGDNGSIASGAITLTVGDEPTIGAGEGDDGACNLLPPDADANQTVDFGFYTLKLGNQVWNDANNNGILDNGEQGINGVLVELLNESNVVVTSTVTANGGIYNFQGFAPGIYRVRITAPAGFVSSTPDAGDPDVDSADNNDNGNGSNGGQISTDLFSILAGSNNGGATVNLATATTSNPNVDFGLRVPLNLGNLIWQDRNNNGTVDVGEPGIPNILVQLFRSTDNPATAVPLATTTTSGSGNYTFTNLIPGEYVICVPTPPAQFPTSSIVTDNNDNGQDNDDNGIQTVSGGLTCSPVIVLTPGDEPTNDGDGANGDLTIDFGFYGSVSVGDRVWYDTNKNGLQDDGEPGVKGVKVTLYDSATGQPVTIDINGTAVQPQQTNDNGNYLFANLPAGSYYVVFDLGTLPQGYLVTTPNVGGNNEIDSDAALGTGKTESVTVTVGSNLSLDMGITPPAIIEVSVGDRVWYDTNKNGLQDEGETGVKGVKVTLYNATTGQVVTSDINGDPIQPQLTDSNGNYLFSKLPVGSYSVVFDLGTLPQGYIVTNPNVGSNNEIDSDAALGTGKTESVTVTVGANLSLDMGIISLEIVEVSVGDRVWYDNNENGLQDDGEPGVKGVLATLYNATTGQPVTSDINGDPIQPQLTDSNGNYLFSKLPVGSYYVVFDLGTLPQGYIVTNPNVGGNNEIDSDAALGTGRTETVVVNSGSNLSLDMGIIPLAADEVRVGDYVWFDDNHNGLQDGNENGVAGVTVTLFDATTNQPVLVGGNPFTQTTGSDGAYLFAVLPAGDYYVVFNLNTLPNGFTPTLANVGGNDETDSDADATGKTAATGALSAGQQDLSLDMGIFAPYSLGNRVWNDNNNNGIIDTGETGIDGFTVNLYADSNNDGTVDGAAIATTTTAGGGYYRFDGLAASSYIVEVVATSTYRSSTPDAGDPDIDVDDNDDNGSVVNGNSVRSVTITLGPNGSEPTGETDLVGGANPQGALDARANMTVDFGFFQLATIGDRVWFDVNQTGTDIGNGIQDAGEKGVAGWIAELHRANGTLVATTTTNANGLYLFTEVIPGDYFIKFAPPPNQTQQFKISAPNQGANNEQDSDADQQTLATAVTTLVAGEDDRSWDMGIYLIGTALGDTEEPTPSNRVFLPVVVR